MSFEAVPCMFRGKAEDGNEASLFGLLIRPSSSTTTTTAAAVTAGSSSIQVPSTTVPRQQEQQASAPATSSSNRRGRQAGRKRRSNDKKSDLQLVSVGSVMVDPTSLMGAMKSGGAMLQIAGTDSKDLFSMQQLTDYHNGDAQPQPSNVPTTTATMPEYTQPGGGLLSPWLVSQPQHGPQPAKRRRRTTNKKTQPMQLQPPPTHYDSTTAFQSQQQAMMGSVDGFRGAGNPSLLMPSSSSSYPNYSAPAYDGYNAYQQSSEVDGSHHQQPFYGAQMPPLPPTLHSAAPANNPYHRQEWHSHPPPQPLCSFNANNNNIINQQNNNNHLMIAAPAAVVYSATPDSGIQSIDGSPPSISSSSFTPPMVSPYAQVASCDSTHSSLHYPNSIPQMSVASTSSLATTCPKGDDCPSALADGAASDCAPDLAASNDDDLSDMPVLVPIIDESNRDETNNEIDTATSDRCGWLEDMCTLDENGPPAIVHDSTTSAKATGSSSTTSEQGEHLLFAVTSSMDLSELAERLYSSIDKDQLDQLTRLIQSKAEGSSIEGTVAIIPGAGSKRQSLEEDDGCRRPSTATEGESDLWLNAYRSRVRSRMSRRVEEFLNGKLSQRFASALQLERTATGRASPQKRGRSAAIPPFPWLQRIDWRAATRRVVGSHVSFRKPHADAASSSMGFVHVKSNVMLQSPEVRSSANSSAIAGCLCSLQAPCSADSRCANRESRRECTSDTCGLPAENCSNRRMSMGEEGCPPSRLEVFETSECGRGLRTRGTLEADAYLGEYVGEAMRRSTFLRRYATASEEEPRYGVELCAGYVVDAMKKGNLLRFINHSCVPNCELQHWTVNGQPRLALFTLRRVEAGKELTYHYGTAGHVGLDPPQQCNCGHHVDSASPTAVILPLSTADRRKRRASAAAQAASRRNDESSEKLIESGGGPPPSMVNERLARRGAAALKSLSEFRSAGAAPLPEISHLLVKLFEDFSSFCRKRERVSERRLRLARKAVKKALLPPSENLPSFPAASSTTSTIDPVGGADVTAESVLLKFDTAMKQSLAAFRRVYNSQRSASIISKYLELKRQLAAFASELQQPSRDEENCDESTCAGVTSTLSVRNEAWARFTESQRERRTACAKKQAVEAATEADLSYMDAGCCPVGSYNPDELGREALLAAKANSVEGSGEDFVRCICGIMEDDGVMTQCERCSFWLHAACLDFDVAETSSSGSSSVEFVCDFCARQVEVTPQVDIVLRPQPKVRLDDCTYYRTLVNSTGLQVRVNEGVYVERLPSDEHKTILRNLHERSSTTSTTEQRASPAKKRRRLPDSSNGISIGHEPPPSVPNSYWEAPPGTSSISSSPTLYSRRDLRIFRVERLFKGPSGHRFVFGCYYARPHETFCDSSRLFHKNELFWTPFFDTLPLEAVVGRCLIMPPQVWQLGRPKSPRYREEDVFVCEYQVDRNQRSFERIAQRDHYHIGTESYVFDYFDTELALKRDFTPFIVPSIAASEARKGADLSSTQAESNPSCSSSTSS